MNETSPPETKSNEKPPTAADETSSATTAGGYSWLPIPAFVLAIISLFVLDIRTVFELLLLMPMINALVFVGASGVAAYLAQRGFLAGGAPEAFVKSVLPGEFVPGF